MNARKARIKGLLEAGMSANTVAAEVLLYLPDRFLLEYELLFHQAWSTADAYGSKKGVDERRGTEGSRRGSSASMGQSAPNERALLVKQRVDRVLAKQADVMAAERVRAATEQGGGVVRRCAGQCKRLCEQSWLYCPQCGSRTEDVELGKGEEK